MKNERENEIERQKKWHKVENAFRYRAIEVQLICAIGRRSEQGTQSKRSEKSTHTQSASVLVQYQQLKPNTHQWI